MNHDEHIQVLAKPTATPNRKLTRVYKQRHNSGAVFLNCFKTNLTTTGEFKIVSQRRIREYIPFFAKSTLLPTFYLNFTLSGLLVAF